MTEERGKLLEQYHATKDPAKRRAIEQRILALDMQANRPGIMPEGAADALSWPQRKLKEAVSGDEAEWFSPEGMNPHLYAAGNTALDLIADPLNALPVGLLGKAAKATPKNQMGGVAISGAENYIKNHYGLTDGPEGLTRTEELLSPLMGSKLTPEQKQAVIRGAQGKVDWAAKSGRNALESVLTPSGRALYADTGINKGLQRTVDAYEQAGTPKDLAKAHANINYNRHQNVQAGREGAVDPSMQTIADRSNLKDYTPYEPGVVSKWMDEAQGESSNALGKLSGEDAKYIEDHVIGTWEGADDVVMKRPKSPVGGLHYNDMYKKSPFTAAVYRAFDKHDGAPTQRQLYDYFKKVEKDQPFAHRIRIKNPSWEDVEKNGLWLTGGLPGTAITEGGVNWVGKVEPDGRLLGVISDKHDFLDKMSGAAAKAINKIPGANVSKDITKRDLIAVTPPMRSTIHAQRPKQAAKWSTKAPVEYSVVPTPKPTQKLSETRRDYVTAQPTPETLKREQMRQAGMLTGAGALTGVGPYDPDG